MRKIKFRAWTNDSWLNKGMLYDYQDTIYVESIGFNNEELPLMQFTGLHDKSGKEIYEGDIVESSIDNAISIDKVVFKKGAFYLNSISEPTFEDELLHEEIERTKVIGNIYENPELIPND